MKSTHVFILISLLLAGGAAYQIFGERLEARPAEPPTAKPASEAPAGEADASQVSSESKVLFAAVGRVETISEERELRAEVDGRIAQIAVHPNDLIEKDQVLAEIANDDYRAAVAVAEAQVAQARATLERVMNGYRSEERREAAAAVERARAMHDNAEIEAKRRDRLAGDDVLGVEEADRARRDTKVWKAQIEELEARRDKMEAGEREEDKAKARADLQLAEANLALARARLDKTVIRSPIRGVVLRRHMNEGETVSNFRDSRILTVGDASTLRIRAEVDEADISKLKLGQRAYATAAAFGVKKITGRVIWISPLFGKKKFFTDEPVERVDTKILEALVELDPGQEVPIGMRLDSYFLADEN